MAHDRVFAAMDMRLIESYELVGTVSEVETKIAKAEVVLFFFGNRADVIPAGQADIRKKTWLFRHRCPGVFMTATATIKKQTFSQVSPTWPRFRRLRSRYNMDGLRQTDTCFRRRNFK